MNPHELSLFLKSAISRLASLGLSPGPTPQQRAIRNIIEAKSAARDLLAISTVKDLAQALLDNDVAKHAVQDSFVYQDDGNLTQSDKLADIRSKPVEFLSVLKNYIDSTLMELPLDVASDPCSALLVRASSSSSASSRSDRRQTISTDALVRASSSSSASSRSASRATGKDNDRRCLAFPTG